MRRRRRAARKLWIAPVYPLLDVLPMDVAGCLAAVERIGWPEPPRSRCHFCPNQSDGEWSQLTPEEWQQACDLDEAVRAVDPNVYLHRSLTPLRMVTLKPQDERDLFTGGCAAGMCF